MRRAAGEVLDQRAQRRRPDRDRRAPTDAADCSSRAPARARGPPARRRSCRPSSSSSIFTAVSTWPASSCSSRAMRRRSSSCARSSRRGELLELGGARRQPIALVAEHQEQQAEPDGEDEQHVGEDAVQDRRAEAAQQRIVEVMEPPQDERAGQHGRRAARRCGRARARRRRRSRCVTPDSSSVVVMPATSMLPIS